MPSNNAPIYIYLPGSKSHTNRALICAALAKGETELVGYGECYDTDSMIAALRSCGVQIKNEKLKIKNYNSKLQIVGGIDNLKLPGGQINVGNAGTAMRFLVSLVGLIAARSASHKRVILTGSARMQERPVGDLIAALNKLGIRVEAVKQNGCPPISVKSLKLKVQSLGGWTILKGEASSQYLSSILLVVPYFDQDSEIKISGELTSKPYVDMTIKVMQDFGVSVINQNYEKFIVKAGQKYQPQIKYQIEPDASAASYFIAGAGLTGRTVSFPRLPLAANQGDINFVKIIRKMQPDAEFKDTDHGLMFKGGTELCGIDVDMNQMPDMVPTLAVLAMFARGRTVIKNVKNLRIKESDRIKALTQEIRKFGVEVKELGDGLIVQGLKFKVQSCSLKFKVNVYNDHRLAMAMAVAKLMLPDIIIESPQCVAKSFPGFWEEWKKL